MDIGAINALSYEEFLNVLGNVVEKCPLITAAVWSERPFSNLDALEAAIGNFIDALPESGQEGILRCHPDLAGKELRSGTLTPESRREQGHAGLDRLDAAEASGIGRLNAEYKARFGFPFVVCVRTSDKRSVPRQLEERLRRGRAEERARAIAEVKKICRTRLRSLVRGDQVNKL